MAAVGAYHHHLWNKALRILQAVSDNLRSQGLSFHQEAVTLVQQEQIAARHVVDAASKQMAAAISLRCHAWFRSAGISEDARSRSTL